VLPLGLVTPVVSLNPRIHNRWEEGAGLDELVAVAEAADRLGYAHLTCSEHVAVPVTVAATRGSRYWDPLATFGYLAARTRRIALATHVLVLGYHHPLEIAKRYGTLDRLCAGRLVLGVGVGSLREEFDLLGADFAGRGARADDALRALWASLSEREPTYSGTHHRYDGFVVDPAAVQARVPLWVGGRTARSLRRAVELADGWVPFGLDLERLRRLLDRRRPAEVVLHPDVALDPAGDPDGVAEVVARYEAVGATRLNLRFRSSSLVHHLEQLEAMAELARR
jgi:probable F420-dependent oxidoreductase